MNFKQFVRWRLVCFVQTHNLKPCYGKCNLCIWKYNGGCSEWNGWGTN